MPITPNFSLWSPDDSDDWDLTIDLAAMAISIDASLDDAVPLPATQGEVNAGVVTDKFVTPATLKARASGHSVRPYGTSDTPVSPPAIVMRSGRFTGTTSPTGVLAMSWSPAFPTACLGVAMTGNQNFVAPVLVDGSANATVVQFFFAGASSASRTVDYIAWGY